MSVQVEKRYILIPSTRRGNGTGHLRRSCRIAAELKRAGLDVFIFTDADAAAGADCFDHSEISALMGAEQGPFPVLSELNQLPSCRDGSRRLVCICDMRESPPLVFELFGEDSFFIGLDEGGAMRGRFDYLIDSLPNLQSVSANTASTAFLQLPAPGSLKSRGGKPVKVLLSFGGEDRSGLTSRLLKLLIGGRFFSPEQITVVHGPFFSELSWPGGVNVLDSPSDLRDRLREWDLVFTLFGMTCFEALYSGVPVILFNPEEYHRKLALSAGIPEIGVIDPDAGKLKRLMNGDPVIESAVRRYSGYELKDPAAFIAGLEIPGGRCRACGSVHGGFVYRDQQRGFFRCPQCGMINLMYFGSESMEYGEDYFFEDYKKQYGRTYLEDFDRIKTAGKRRCRLIDAVGGKIGGSGRLLDMGCGYGPFLSAAADGGFNPAGIDISENAVDWIRDNLGFDAAAFAVEDFEAGAFGEGSFDVVTMWFVIEHLSDLRQILGKINSLLNPGGVFAFSTPNYNGISRRRHIRQFLQSSPVDHYTIWDPGTARSLLAEHGFRVKKIVCPVIHPGRFFKDGFFGKLPRPVRSAVSTFVTAMGRLLRLGDTFEVYAVKVRDDNGNDSN